MTIVAGLAANCQAKTDTVCLYQADYDAMLSKLSNLTEEVKSLRQLKEDTATLRQAIKLKDQAFLALKKQSDDNRADMDTLFSIKRQQADIINKQAHDLALKESRIDKQGKPKRWGIGPVAGYGLAGQSFGAFMGIGISYGLRF